MENTPFIKLFSSPWNKYFYDVGRNEIVLISEQLYSSLHLLETGAVDWQGILNHASEELSALLEEGYLSCKRPIIVRHPLSELTPYYLQRKIDMITLQITQDCNFRCRYCIYSEHINRKQRSHSQKCMTWETAKRAIDFYIAHSIDSEIRSIGLYGGEPLLQFELIKKIIEYSEEAAIGKPLDFHMTTNGSLLTNNVVEFLAKHQVQLLISIDGNKASHDKNRVLSNGTGTYDLVMNNLMRVRKAFPDYYASIQINTVLDPSNDFDSLTGLNGNLLGLPNGNFRFNYVENDDEDSTLLLSTPDFREKDEYQSFLSYLAICGKYPIEQLSPLSLQRFHDIESAFKRFQSEQYMPDMCSHGGPCIAGKSRLFITSDGVFYPCERVNERHYMSIGSLDSGFDYDNIKRLMNICELTAEKCKNCWAIRSCSICSKMCDNGKMLSAEEKLKHCDESKHLVETQIRSIILQSELYYHHCSKEVSS